MKTWISIITLFVMVSILQSSPTDSTVLPSRWQYAWSTVKPIPVNFVKDFYAIHTSPFRITKKGAYWTSGILAAGTIIYIFDDDINNGFKHLRGNYLYDRYVDIGEVIEPVGLKVVTTKYYLGLFLVGLISKNEFLTNVNLQILEAIIVTAFLKEGINYYAGRPRPRESEDAHEWGVKDARSFFSGHSTNTFQLATILSHHINNKWFSFLVYGLAGAVAVQRCDSQSHWPSDVFTGIVYGVATAKGIIYLNEKSKNKISLILAKPDNGYGISVSYSF